MKKFLIPIIIVVVVLAIVAGVLMWMFFANNAAEEKVFVAYFSPGESIVTNTAVDESGVSRLVKATMTLLISEKDKEEFLTAEIPAIRDTIIRVMRSKTIEEMRDPAVQTNLSDEICIQLNSQYEVEFFKQVYFIDFVIN